MINGLNQISGIERELKSQNAQSSGQRIFSTAVWSLVKSLFAYGNRTMRCSNLWRDWKLLVVANCAESLVGLLGPLLRVAPWDFRSVEIASGKLCCRR